MKPYISSNGKSGVTAYDIINDGIWVRFRDGSVYLYDYETTGKFSVEVMKMLARKGKKLTSYINRYIRSDFAEKLI